jgi:hypothetical protein
MYLSAFVLEANQKTQLKYIYRLLCLLFYPEDGDRKFLRNACKLQPDYVGFEVFTAVVLKSIFFWDMTQCSP